VRRGMAHLELEPLRHAGQARRGSGGSGGEAGGRGRGGGGWGVDTRLVDTGAGRAQGGRLP
jgi:hypothetical protein